MPVRDAALGGLDFADPGFQSDPWPLYDWYREHAPVCWSEEMKCFFVFGYQHVRHVLTAPEFTAYHPFRRSRVAFGPSALDSEGLDHARLRKALAGPFRPGAVTGYGGAIVEPVVGNLLGTMLNSDRDDWVDEFAWRLPTRVACRVLGIAETEDATLYELMRPLILFVDHAPVTFATAVDYRDRLRAYLRGTMANGMDRHAMLAMLAANDNLTEVEAVDNAILLLAAATETTCSATINLIARVAGQPGLFDLVRADPDSIPAVVTETLRHEPPLHVTLRYAAEDIQLAGVDIPKGASVQVCIASANRDPEMYPEPGVWDPQRDRRTFLTFGLGRHHCLGMGLAQLELETVLRELTQRVDGLWTTAPEDPTPRGRTFRSVPGLRLGHSLRAVG